MFPLAPFFFEDPLGFASADRINGMRSSSTAFRSYPIDTSVNGHWREVSTSQCRSLRAKLTHVLHFFSTVGGRRNAWHLYRCSRWIYERAKKSNWTSWKTLKRKKRNRTAGKKRFHAAISEMATIPQRLTSSDCGVLAGFEVYNLRSTNVIWLFLHV